VIGEALEMIHGLGGHQQFPDSCCFFKGTEHIFNPSILYKLHSGSEALLGFSAHP